MKIYLTPPVPDSIWKNPFHFIAFGFGSGAIPFAPGTFGTLMAIPFYIVLATLPSRLYVFAVLIIMFASMWLCGRVSKEINAQDHQGMCLDEFVGFFVTMIGMPLNWIWIVLGFLLFRFFDIVKPWPISWMDSHIHGGVGMILDDVAAGVVSCVILHVIKFL